MRVVGAGLVGRVFAVLVTLALPRSFLTTRGPAVTSSEMRVVGVGLAGTSVTYTPSWVKPVWEYLNVPLSAG